MKWHTFLEWLFPMTPADCPKTSASMGSAGGSGQMSKPIQMGGADEGSMVTGYSRSNDFNMRLAKDLRDIAHKLEQGQ